MLQNDKTGATAGRILPPEQWDIVKVDAIGRARAMRTETLCAAVNWAAGGAVGLLRGAVKAYTAWFERRRAIRDLHVFDNRSLWDIGINRSEIESAVRDWDPTRIPRGVARQRPRATARGTVSRPVTKRAA
jgi:uncharacterized protein YjiS (DUF1127 family)